MIEFQNVTVCYAPSARHPVNAITDINLKIEKGEWVFLVGPSGAGKSTLLKLLHCGIHAPAQVRGRILLDKQDITDLSSREIPFVRRKIGVVFQDFQLLAQKTAWENIAFSLRVIGAPQRVIAREVPRALDTVGLAHKAHAQPHELSGGEQQRIAIARAIVNNPALLLADEPTGNLDPETASGIAEVLQRINEELGTTVVMATHDRHLVDSLKRRVVRVRDGGIASDELHGIYHPEDDDPVPVSQQPEPASVASTPAVKSAPRRVRPVAPARTSAPESTPVVAASPAATSTPAAAGSPASERVSPRERVKVLDPVDAFASETLKNEAPLGSDENPIVQYGKN